MRFTAFDGERLDSRLRGNDVRKGKPRTSATEVRATRFNNNGSATGPWNNTSPSIISAFQLDGTAAPTVTPEPASLFLFGAGLLGLAILAWKKRWLLVGS